VQKAEYRKMFGFCYLYGIQAIAWRKEKEGS
jgi:hypothetical protein